MSIGLRITCINSFHYLFSMHYKKTTINEKEILLGQKCDYFIPYILKEKYDASKNKDTFECEGCVLPKK